MRRIPIHLTLILCLVLCVFAFASCGKKDAAKTTAATTGGECAHVWGDYVVDVEPTCSEPGVKSKYCTICGAQDPASIVAVETIAHTEADNYTVDTPATCIAKGYESKHCTVCRAIIASTVRAIEIDENAHNVEDWEVTSPVSLLNPTGSRHGTCSLCHQPQNEVIQFKHDVQTFTTASGKYTAGGYTLGEIRGDKHFYDAGNDLLVEYSILWNDTLPNLYSSESVMPAVDTRFTLDQRGTSKNKGIVRLELVNDCPSQWCTCKFAGGFTATGTPESGHLYPRFGGTVADITAYPNIGGANLGDGEPLGETQWGWHRVQIRVREEVTNLDAVKSGADATYFIQIRVYIDGVLVSHTSTTEISKDAQYDRQFFTAASDGAGGIVYTENDAVYLHGAFLDSTRMKSGEKGYYEIADYSVTVGSAFVQNVRKVTVPAPDTLEVETGVFVPSTMWFESAD